jgi:hypothetical protein
MRPFLFAAPNAPIKLMLKSARLEESAIVAARFAPLHEVPAAKWTRLRAAAVYRLNRLRPFTLAR